MKTIKLSQGKKTIVDDKTFEKYGHLAWHTKKHGKTFYAKHSNRTGPVYLHRLILPSTFLEVDHIDGDGLNNLTSNLRLVTRRQQMQNQHGISKTSRYPGVYWNTAADKWQAYAQHKNKSIYLGVFSREKDAAAKSQSFRDSLPT